jgi:hypothetical protein
MKKTITLLAYFGAITTCSADFSGAYAPANFTFFNSAGGSGSINTSAAPASITITGSDGGAQVPYYSLYSATAVSTGTLTFNWSYHSNDTSQDSTYDPASFKLGTNLSLLTTGSGINQNGTGSYHITNGTLFGFQVDTTDNYGGAGILTISDFLFLDGPSPIDTQISLQANVAALQGIYAIQTGTINNSLTYDCSYFDSKGFCLSSGGRYSNASNSHANTTSAMVIGGYRFDEHFRFGAYVDQNLYNTEAGSVASLRSNTPLIGVFGVWNENADQTGFEARLAAAYNNSNMDINRVQVGTSEMGYGKTGIDTLSGSATLSYGIKVVPNWMASPYFGVRHTTVSSSGYSEQATADVTAPLTYNGVNQESLTALLGIKASGRLTDQIGLQASAGLEQDMHTYTSAYTATGVDGLTAINFTPNMQKSRAVSTFGATYDVAKGHRLGLNAIWRQESFQSVDTKMAYVNYTMAF